LPWAIIAPLADSIQAPFYPARPPQRTSLEGQIVSIVPVDLSLHGATLYERIREHDHLWTYLSDGPFADSATFTSALEQKACSEDPLFFTIVENRSGLPAGHAAYLRITPAHGVIEVGHILFTPALQRTCGATEAMYLMARHVFEDLGYRRYEWKCDTRNAPSHRAALRLGFTFEGIFRQHMIVKGGNRDTAWFSMLDSEWPSRKAALEKWLDPLNFDEEGRQRRPLSHFQKRST
jgi:RimJ/RimL family protein N-acetyltransferase